MHFFFQKMTFFILRPQNTVKIKQIKRSAVRCDMVKFLVSVHTITEAKQSNRQGGARAGDMAVDLPVRSFARPGVALPLWNWLRIFIFFKMCPFTAEYMIYLVQPRPSSPA